LNSASKSKFLSVDKSFEINEFVLDNGNLKLWQVSNKLIELISDLATSENQKSLINKFVAKNGFKNVFDIERSIYNMLTDVIKCVQVVEEAETKSSLN
jgi:hypothetical protein